VTEDHEQNFDSSKLDRDVTKEQFDTANNKSSSVDVDETKCINYEASDLQYHSNYYDIPPHFSPSQYFPPGPIYNENNPEVSFVSTAKRCDVDRLRIFQMFSESHQQFNYAPRPNETMMPSTTMPSQMPHPHIVFAPPPESIGITPGNEICYPAVQAPVLIQPSHYRYNVSISLRFNAIFHYFCMNFEGTRYSALVSFDIHHGTAAAGHSRITE
jgi:hypothetical protein